MTMTDPRPSTSPRATLKATVTATACAAVLLVVAVLPAEYGIDPTGVGQRLGLLALHAARTSAVPPAAAAPAVVVTRTETPFQIGEMELTLQPAKGAEIKAAMASGQSFVFTWTAEGGVVDFDMHGEPLRARKDEFTSYWRDRDRLSGHGTFTAPFAGTHGWYWYNAGPASVTIRVKVGGYYQKFYRP